MDKLQQFYLDSEMRDGVHDALVTLWNEEVIRRAKSRESNECMSDFLDIIEKLFSNLENTYGEKPKVKTKNSR